MILNIPKRLNNIVAIAALSIGLVACGGDGGSAPAASAVAQPATVVGKLVPDVRSRSFSSTYGTDEGYKNLVDAFLVAMNELVVEIDSVVKWQSDIPVIFSGCGQLNAFFSPEVDLHASFAADGVADPTAVFGANSTGNALVMCHELTEAALKEFFLNATTLAAVSARFGATTDEEVIEAAVFSALIFELQILFHEIGHAMDSLLINDTVNNTTKVNNFSIPLANTCALAGCDTISEDFADWISAFILSEVLKGAFEEDPTDAAKFAAATLSALNSWSTILGAGGGVVHGFTESRQVNMLCYIFGGVPGIRTADAANLNNGLAVVLAAKGLNTTTCKETYTANSTATETLLGSFFSD